MFKDNNQKENFYHTSLILGKKITTGTEPGNKKLKKLLEEHKTFENIAHHFWGNLFDFEKAMLNDVPNLEEIINKIEKTPFEFEIIRINDNRYPNYLKNIEGASPVIYSMGNLDLLNSEKSIAVVGTRKPAKKDLKSGEEIVKRLVDNNYTIVSGLASGCDTLGHQKAIEYGGKTIGVLGTPLNIFYPKENNELQKTIAKTHLLISQYPIGIRTFPSHFSHRNIMTVGLSKNGIVVISAGDKSGTQHAIRHCAKSTKPIYVLKNNFEKNYNWLEKYKDSIKIPNKGEK